MPSILLTQVFRAVAATPVDRSRYGIAPIAAANAPALLSTTIALPAPRTNVIAEPIGPAPVHLKKLLEISESFQS